MHRVRFSTPQHVDWSSPMLAFQQNIQPSHHHNAYIALSNPSSLCQKLCSFSVPVCSNNASFYHCITSYASQNRCRVYCRYTCGGIALLHLSGRLSLTPPYQQSSFFPPTRLAVYYLDQVFRIRPALHLLSLWGTSERAQYAPGRVKGRISSVPRSRSIKLSAIRSSLSGFGSIQFTVIIEGE
jgi:hypothetical protein